MQHRASPMMDQHDSHDVGRQARVSAGSDLHGLLSRSTCRILAALLLFGLGSPSIGTAAEPDVASLEREVAALSALVQRLQARVDRLELQASSAGPSASDPARTEPAVTPQKSVQASAGAVSRAEAPAAPIAARRTEADSIGPSAQVQLRSNWAKIGAGMTSAEVSGLLGDPSRRLTLDGRSVWYYSYPSLGNGSVFFTDSGQVSSRQSPFVWGR